MCGRFTQQHSGDQLAARFETEHTLFTPEPRYNIAPTQTVAVIVADAKHERYLEGFLWGLVPSWAKETSIGSKMINARAETVFEKPAFRESIRHKRCLIPADGFYEWQKIGAGKEPYHFRLDDCRLFAFAGIWASHRLADGTDLVTCSILTTTANALVAPIHDRMPVLLNDPAEEKAWLDDTSDDPELLRTFLRPYPADRMEKVKVDRRVGSPVNDFPELLHPNSA